MIKKLLPIIILLIFFIGCSSKQSMIKNEETIQKKIYTTQNTNSLVQKSGQYPVGIVNKSDIIIQTPNDSQIIKGTNADYFFINPTDGWKASYNFIGMFNEDMILYKTNNGGKTWDEIANSKNNTLLIGDKTGIYFIDSNKGWITSNTPWEGIIGLYSTDDSGITWNKQNLNIPDNYKHSLINAYPPLFFSNLDGILLTFPASESTKQNFLFFVTNDGGKTWNSVLDRIGKLGNMKWNFQNSASINNYEVTYNNTIWFFDNGNWYKRIS